METNEYLTKLKAQIKIYVSLGWSVIPLVWCDKVPDKRVLPIMDIDGKRVASWQQFQKRTPIQWELKTWFGHVRNVGIVTGALSKIIVVDCDNEAARQWLLDRSLVPENTPTVKTGKGWHFYFAYPEGETIGNRRAMHTIPGLDLRGEGGQVVAPPSIHATGFQYHWLNEPHGYLPTLPDWFLHEKKATPPGEPMQGIGGSHHSQQKSPATYWERLISERLARLRITRIYRNEELNRTAFILGQVIGLKHANRANIEVELWAAARAIGLEEREIGKTIASGLNAGISQCNDLEAYRREQQRRWADRQNKGRG